MKKLLRIFFAMLILLVLLVVCLPWLCSTGFVKSKVLGIANKKIDGSVSVDEWSLRWTRKISFRGIVFEDPGSATRVAVDEVRTDRGLLGFLLNRKNLGTVYVDAPFVTATVPEHEPSPPVESFETEKGSEPDETSPAPTPDKPFAMPDLAVRLIITNGTFALANAGQAPETVATDAHVTAVLEGAESAVNVVAGFTSPDDKGHLDLVASFQADPTGAAARPRVHASIEANDLDLSPLTTFAAQFAEVPVVDGILNAKVNVDGAATEDLRMSGVVSVPDLRMSGGPLSSDTPSLGDVVLSVEGLVSSNSIRIDRLNFETAVARISTSGDLSSTEDSQLKLEGRVDLTMLLAQFPATLGVREGLQIEEGALELGAEISTSGEDLSVRLTALLPVLRGTVATESMVADIAWDQPTVLKFEGQKHAQAVTIQTFRLDAPFASVTGKGDLNHLEVSVSAELGELREEIGKLVDLEPWQFSGKLMVSAKLDRPTAGDVRLVQCDITLNDAEIAHGSEALMPRGSWNVQIASGISTNQDGFKIAFLDPSLSWKLPVGQGKIAAQSIGVPEDGGEGPEIIGGSIKADVDLERAFAVMNAIETAPEGLSLRGDARMNLAFGIKNQQLDVGPSVLSVQRLYLEQEDKTLSDPQISLSVKKFRAGPDQLISVNGARLKTTMGEIVISALEVPINHPASAKASMQASFALKSVQDVLGDFLTLPDQTSIDGSASIRLDISDAPAGGRLLAMDAELAEFDLLSGGQAVLENDGATVKVRLVAGEPLGKIIVIEELAVHSKFLQLAAAGEFQAGDTDLSVDVKGTLGLDLEAAETYVRNLAGLDIVLRGKGNEPFAFQSTWSPVNGDNVLTRANLQATLRADQIQAFGFDLQSIQLPVSIASGLFQGELRADVNQGSIEVLPELDFSQESRTLVLRNPTNLISNVELTKEIADGFLGRIHPLFKGASVIGGRFDMGMDNFSWPLEAERRNEAAFQGVMEFHDLRLGASGLSKKILAAMKVKEQSVEVGARQIEFQCENGKISTSPTSFKVEGNEVTLSGTVGLDESLDYVATVPLTDQLVSSNLLKYLEDTTINVPIRGTVSKPILNASVLTEAAADLAAQAGKKALKKEAGKFLEREGGNLFDKFLK
jgi:hypothetical protein